MLCSCGQVRYDKAEALKSEIERLQEELTSVLQARELVPA